MSKAKRRSVHTRRRTTDGLRILRNRYLKRDRELAQAVAHERANMAVARQLCDLREKAGLSQRALARMVGTTASVICRLEDADYEGHSLAMLNRIAEVLDRRVEVRFVSRRRA
jgi:ribosome-binding protein aMBF1 (putative translation factor)